MTDPAVEVGGFVEVQGDYRWQQGLGILGVHLRKTGARFTATKISSVLLGSAALRRSHHRATVPGLRRGHPSVSVAIDDPAVFELLHTTKPDVVP